MLPYVENSLLLLSQFLHQSVPPKIKTLKFVYLVDKTMQICIQILSLNLLGIVIIIKKKKKKLRNERIAMHQRRKSILNMKKKSDHSNLFQRAFLMARNIY